MAPGKAPMTSAIRVVRASNSPSIFTITRVSSRELGTDEHSIVKTLVMADDRLGGARPGFLVGMEAQALNRVLPLVLVDVALSKS